MHFFKRLDVLEDSIVKLQNEYSVLADRQRDTEDNSNRNREELLKKIECDVNKIEELSESLSELKRSLQTVECFRNETENIELPVNMQKDVSEYEDLLHDEIRDFISKYDRRPYIIVLCEGLKHNYCYEAIRKEAYNIFSAIKSKLGLNVKIVSIENQNIIKESGGIVYLPEDMLADYLAQMHVSLLLACEATATIFFKAGWRLLKYNALLRLSSQVPFMGVDERMLEQLKHLNDYGFVRFAVMSSVAEKQLIDNGMKNVEIIYPVLKDVSKKCIKKNMNKKNMNKKRIGFASSPMDVMQIEPRGIMVLADLAQKCPEYEFLILWRNTELPLPDSFNGLANVQVEYGYYDMERFFNDIDLLLIPYQSMEHNHGCSMSAIEALQRRIPVVSTIYAGVSELIESYGGGAVCDGDSQSIKDSLNRVFGQYDLYQEEISCDFLERIDGIESLCSLVDMSTHSFCPDNIVTLDEWETLLNRNGKHLIRGALGLKEHYREQEVAKNYSKDRFMEFPHNYIDLMERISVDELLCKINGSGKLEILDIACGEGRITQEIIKYGNCTAIDSSDSMLQIAGEKVVESGNQLVLCKMDYFSDALEKKYDVITAFRYIRHYEYLDRKKLYGKIRDNLNEKGYFIFDVPNIVLELKTRQLMGWENYNIYDVFWSMDGIRNELRDNGFHVIYTIPIGAGVISDLLPDYKKEPVTWTVCAVPEVALNA